MFHTPPASPVTPPPTCTSGQLHFASPLHGSTPEGKGRTHKDTRDVPVISSSGNLDVTGSPNTSQEWAVITSGSSPSPVKAGIVPSVKRETFGCSEPKASSSSSSSTVLLSSARTPCSPVKPTDQTYQEKDSGLGPSLTETTSGPGSPCVEENLLEQCWKALGHKSSIDPTPSLPGKKSGMIDMRVLLRVSSNVLKVSPRSLPQTREGSKAKARNICSNSGKGLL